MNAPSYSLTFIALLFIALLLLLYCRKQGNSMISLVRSSYLLRGVADLKAIYALSFTRLETSVLNVNIFDIKSRR